jgi:GT2 family glycosyltransferase
VVIPVFNNWDELLRAVESILDSTLPPQEIIVVDDCSTDTPRFSGQMKNPCVEIVRNARNLGKAYCLNAGLSRSRGDLVVITDPDVVFQPETIRRWADAMLGNPELAVVGSPVCFLSDPSKVTHAGAQFGKWTLRTHFLQRGVGFGYLSGKGIGVSNQIVLDDAYMIRRAAALQVGGYASETFPFMLEDADLQYRLFRRGYKQAIVYGTFVLHPSVDGKRSDLSRLTPNKARYMIRNKILFATRYRDMFCLTTFAMTLPAYVAFYTAASLLGAGTSRKRLETVAAVWKGLVDGLLLGHRTAIGQE